MSLLKANAVQLGQSITATNNFVLYQPASPDGTVRLGNGNSGSVTDLVTLTSAGNLGIGTASPGAASGYTTLDVSNATNGARIRCLVGATAYGGMYTNGTTDFRIGSLAAVPLYIITGSNTIATFDTSGNLGLNVTPKAWSSAYRAIEIGYAGNAIFASTSSAQLQFSSNSYYDGAWKYAANGTASNFLMLGGEYRWNIASNNLSGAGAALTFTQAMTLDASGNLLVGYTSSAVSTANIQSNIGIYSNPNVSTGGLQIAYKLANINDNSAHVSPSFPNFTGNVIISSSAGLTAIPIYANAGSGVAFSCTYLTPGTGTWAYTATNFSFSFTQPGTGGNTYTVAWSGGGATITVTRTAGSLAYTFCMQSMVAA